MSDLRLRAGFESALFDAWKARDFDAWNSTRLIFSDYLEEQNDPLYPMARARCQMHPCMVRTNGGPRVWLWRLTFSLPQDYDPMRNLSRWARNRRMNGAPLLGFPRAVLRCMEAQYGFARFTVTFKPRSETRWVKRLRGVLRNAQTLVASAFDTALHPLGFARLFWPANYPKCWEPEREVAHEPGLFDILEAK